MFEEITKNIVTVMVGVLSSTVCAGVVAYFRKKTECLQKVADDVANLRERSERMEKALIIIVKLQEDVVNKTHPDIKPEWEEIIKELLDDDRG